VSAQTDLLDLLAEMNEPTPRPSEGILCPGGRACPSPIRHKAGLTASAIKFEEFHRVNPGVYAAFLFVSRLTVRRTRTDRLGLSQMLELVRWTIAIRTESEDEFKVSDACKTFYARLAMLDDTLLAGRFHTKASCAANLWADHQAAYRQHLTATAA
jgi:hypothetical protein